MRLGEGRAAKTSLCAGCVTDISGSWVQKQKKIIIKSKVAFRNFHGYGRYDKTVAMGGQTCRFFFLSR